MPITRQGFLGDKTDKDELFREFQLYIYNDMRTDRSVSSFSLEDYQHILKDFLEIVQNPKHYYKPFSGIFKYSALARDITFLNVRRTVFALCLNTNPLSALLKNNTNSRELLLKAITAKLEEVKQALEAIKARDMKWAEQDRARAERSERPQAGDDYYQYERSYPHYSHPFGGSSAHSHSHSRSHSHGYAGAGAGDRGYGGYASEVIAQFTPLFNELGLSSSLITNIPERAFKNAYFAFAKRAHPDKLQEFEAAVADHNRKIFGLASDYRTYRGWSG